MSEVFLTGRLVSVQVGKPQKLETASGRVWESAIGKQPVADRVMVRPENLEGDKQANRKYHGGPDKAVCGYSAEHYPGWQERVGVPMGYGAFGENFTVSGLTEDVLCIGDTFTVGGAIVQVSQPRMPCANVAKRWNTQKLPHWMEETGHTGFYMRVLQEGAVGANDVLTLTERIYPDWTVLRANHLLYGKTPNPEELTALRELPLLTGEWKRALGRKLQKVTT